MTENRFYMSALGLLHDIGKFWQRAESSAKQPLAPQYEQFNVDDYGKNGAHATWSAAFVEEYLRHFNADWSPILYHHKPENGGIGAQRLALADRLASGERASTDEAQPQQLLSIFSSMARAQEKLYFPLKPLRIDQEVIFPKPVSSKNVKADYKNLWEKFTIQSQKMLSEAQDFPELVAILMSLLKEYTWCVPSAFYRSNPDISLYDHSRVTGAIAACIADLSDTLVVDLLQKLNNKTPDKEHTIAYMLVGDVSGVQQFIYTITAKGAASALRGRSFYIQSLTDAVAYYTLQLMNLPLTNLIYSGGGNFIVLIPAQEHSRLEELQSHLDEILITAHGSDLYVAIGATPLTCQDFQIDNFHEVWKRAFRAVGHAKRQRFSTLPPLDLYKKVFQPQGLGGDDQLECQVTHYEGKDVKPVKVGEDQFVRKSRMVRDLEALGQDLRTASGMLIVITPPDAQALDYSEEQGLGVRNVLRALGYHVYFYANSSEEEIHLPETINYSFVAGLKDLPSAQAIKYFRTRLSSSVPLIPIMRFMANVMPSEKDGKIKDFSQLAKESEGIQRLGVLRMDVDDLGKLFVDGFKHDNSGNNNDDKKGKNLSTLARVSSLSFAMQLYFEGWVGHLCEQKHNIYTVYSGGDDLFIVGTWHSVLELATEIREDFQRFCGSVATLSGGLSLHGAKEPLYQAAEIAHDALDLAKDLPNKDGFTLFRYPLKWAHFSEVLKQAEILQNIVKDTQGNRRILQILLQMHELYQELRPLYAQVEDEKEIVWGPYMWRASYLLYRLYERTKVREIESIRQQLQENNFTNLKQLAVAARLTEIRTRREKTNDSSDQ